MSNCGLETSVIAEARFIVQFVMVLCFIINTELFQNTNKITSLLSGIAGVLRSTGPIEWCNLFANIRVYEQAVQMECSILMLPQAFVVFIS
jgi:hypothetical protein